MAPKSKKLKTEATTSETGSVPASSSDVAPPFAPVATGDEEPASTSASAHSGATGADDTPAVLSAPSSPPVTSETSQAIVPATSGARSLDVDNLPLRFDTIDSALSDGLIGRESLKSEDDDFEQEKSYGRPKKWVRKLVNAFAEDYLGEPEDTKRNTSDQKEWYARWQKQAHVGVVAIFEMKDPSHLEKCCWYLFDAIIKAHELGVFTMASNNWSPSKLKCSKRLAVTVSIIEKYATVRLDILRLWHIEEIAANPEAFIKRKLTNCWNNGIRSRKYGKSKKDSEADVQETSDEAEAQASSDVEEEGSRAASPRAKGKQDVLPQSPGENKTSVDDISETKGKVGGKGKAKRARSTTPAPRDTKVSKKPATRKSPTVKKAPVALDTKGRSNGTSPSARPEAEQ